jgi:hypothetical protein
MWRFRPERSALGAEKSVIARYCAISPAASAFLILNGPSWLWCVLRVHAGTARGRQKLPHDPLCPVRSKACAKEHG